MDNQLKKEGGKGKRQKRKIGAGHRGNIIDFKADDGTGIPGGPKKGTEGEGEQRKEVLRMLIATRDASDPQEPKSHSSAVNPGEWTGEADPGGRQKRMTNNDARGGR